MEKCKLTVNLCGEKGNTSYRIGIFVKSDREVSFGSYGLSYDLADIYQQIMYVKQYFGKEVNHEMIHLILKYGDYVNDDRTACVYSESCAEYFMKNYQIYYCTHQDIDSGKYHTHMLINPVSYVNGEMLNTSIENMNQFCEYISDLSGTPAEFLFEKK